MKDETERDPRSDVCSLSRVHLALPVPAGCRGGDVVRFDPCVLHTEMQADSALSP